MGILIAVLLVECGGRGPRAGRADGGAGEVHQPRGRAVVLEEPVCIRVVSTAHLVQDPGSEDLQPAAVLPPHPVPAAGPLPQRQPQEQTAPARAYPLQLVCPSPVVYLVFVLPAQLDVQLVQFAVVGVEAAGGDGVEC